MHTNRLLPAFALVASLATGCAHAIADHHTNIRLGETSEAEVIELLGSPMHRSSFTSDNPKCGSDWQTLTYSERTGLGSMDTVMISLDGSGVVCEKIRSTVGG